MKLAKCILWLTTLVFTSLGLALPEDRLQAVNIEADSAQLSNKTHETIYRGNVVLTQGTLKITADEVIISVLDGGLSKVSATGTQASLFQKVKPDQPPVSAVADHIDFDVSRDALLLQGSARVEHGDSSFEGNRIEYRITEEVVTANERVRMTIPTINTNNPPPNAESPAATQP